MASLSELRTRLDTFGRGEVDEVKSYSAPIECRVYDAGANTVIVDHLEVVEESRGGVGAAMLDAVERAARERGMSRVEVEVHASSDEFEGATEGLLQSAGYTVAERPHGVTDGTVYCGTKGI